MELKKQSLLESEKILGEKFGIKNTFEFQTEIKKGGYDKALSWLQYIVTNREKFPHYFVSEDWLKQRELELFDAAL